MNDLEQIGSASWWNRISEGTLTLLIDVKEGLSPISTPEVMLGVLASIILLLIAFFFCLRRLRKDLKRRTARLSKSEHQIELMGDYLPGLTLFQLIRKADGLFEFTHLSKGYESALGFDRKEVMDNARAILDQIYEKDLPKLQNAFQQSRQDRVPQDLEIRMLDVSGQLKWLHVGAVPHWEGSQLIWDGFVRDITSNKYIEDALTEENRNFQNLFETIDDLLIVCDMNGRLLHTNPSVENRLGHSAKELKTMSIFELVPGDARNNIYQLMARMQSDKNACCKQTLKSANGTRIPMEINLFKGAWRNIPVIFAVARDISFHQKTETALRESQQMLQLIMDTIPMSVFWKDRDSIYMGCNKTFLQECGLKDMHDVIGKNPHDLFPDDRAKTITARDQNVLDSDEPLFNFLESHTRSDGSAGWREISKIPFHDTDGQTVGVLGVWRDVTEQNRAKEELKRTLENMERFNQLMRGRERRTLELKEEINELLKELGRERKYRTTAGDITP